MKQILTDTLLGIHEYHPFTCPFINALIFQGKTCSRAYDIDINYNPKDLDVYSGELHEVVEGLNKWVTDVIALYENLPADLKEQKEDLQIDLMIQGIRELLEFNIDVSDQERDINELVDRWLAAHNQYKELTDQIQNQERALDVAESMIDINSDDSDVKAYRQSERDRSAADLQLSEDLLQKLENEFTHEISELFEYETESYSRNMEQIRTRNDTLREETRALIECLSINFKNELNFEQPNDYLNRKFGIKDSLSGVRTLNLGLIYNNTPFNVNNIDEFTDNEDGREYLIKLVNDLCKRNILTSADRQDFKDKINPFMLIRSAYLEKYGIEKAESRTPEFQKNMLLEKLKKHGYKVVRFYESIEDYTSNKDNFKTVALKDWGNTMKHKTKIKPA